nr:MAG TPA: hypothetical protein [Caudoviricetes sp.]
MRWPCGRGPGQAGPLPGERPPRRRSHPRHRQGGPHGPPLRAGRDVHRRQGPRPAVGR